MPRLRAVSSVSICLAALLAGCGSSSSSSTKSTNSTGSANSTGGTGSTGSTGGTGGSNKTVAPKVASGGVSVTLKKSKLGEVLAGPRGLTLYLFEADKGSKSTCSGACASVWPPLLSSTRPQAGPGLTAALLATSRRADGSSQVTYGGHPLYTYAKDGDSGDLYGQGLRQFGAAWYVLSAKGSKIDAS